MTSIQFDYSTLSTSISRSELGSIIGRHIVEPSYDINEESISENSSRSSQIYVHPSPPDKYKLVYLTFGLLGISTLLPWNFFITANDYWMFKFRDASNKTCISNHNKTDLQAAFTSYIAVANNVPYVIFLIISLLFNNKFSKMYRVIVSLLVMLVLFVIVTVFVHVDSDSWQNGFFILTLSFIIALGISSAILQAGIAAVASLLPPKYMHIMVLGQAIAGIIAAIAQTLSLLGHCDSVKSAFAYFIFADVLIFLSLLSYAGIQKSEFFKYHVYSLRDTTILKDVSEPGVKTKTSILLIFKLIWPFALTILFDFWVTIGIFPGLAVLAVPTSHGSFWDGKIFLPIACFLLFNLSDFCGRFVGGWLPIPSSKRNHLLIWCSTRFLFIPLFMLCNLLPRHNLPVVFENDSFYISFMALLGLTNGYFVSVAMMIGVQSVNPLLQEMAGVVLSSCLGAGLMLGAASSYIFIQII